MMRAAVLLLSLSGLVAADLWQGIRDGVDTWGKLKFNTDFAVNVGDRTGRKFVYQIGKTTMESLLEGASSSKWPTTTMISGLVKDGILSYDDKPSQYLSWWATDPSDARSHITLRHLLSFTDGYLQDGSADCAKDPSYDFVTCVHELYNATVHSGKMPGTTWAYLSSHYQFAGAMAVAASGVPIDKLYEKYLYNAYGMKNTTWGSPPYKNPQLAAGIRSTGDDYEKFLYGTLTNSFLPKNITDVLETDWTAPPVTPSGMFFGHYCMGNFFECYGYTIGLNASQPDVLPDRCKEEKIHSDPGLWGWFPIMDRSREYYYQVVIQENYVKAGIPEYLTMIAKPMINNIMKGRDPTKVNRQELLEGGGGLILRDIVGIDIASRVIPSGINVERPNLGLWLNLWEGLFSWHGQRFTSHFVFNVGNSSGTQFTSEKGFMTMHTRVKGASLSKWPAAVAIAGLVADKIMSFDDKASKYLSWWTKDPADPRSAITLRHLLSFTSGYEKDVDVKCASNPSANYLECAKELYEAIPAGKPANTTWTYLSCHLQFAGAMAVAASGLEIDQIFERYLYKKVGMTDTTWGDAPYKNPSMAGGIVTTGKDFERFLKGLLEYTVLPKEVCDEMEQDYSGHTQPSGDAWFGHYGMGHWFECIGYGTPGGPGAALPKRCKDEAIQAGPGLYGYYPLIDRKRGYYMQIVVQESLEKSGIPEYLRIVTKPVVDAIMEGKLVANVNRYDLLTAGGGILLRDLVYIQQSRDGEL